ncbi:vanadium-dependent haloperoxidase [Nostoc sphaeroides]|uniref:vanadium-dependent haloperoxidase n=1 Tax=Nostoc sphaeroides TaxID=446679 RepID=UPI000E4D8FAD|nr:vanadium-dependent haloperoxidase [Nostoc sphaeroides]
MASDIVIQFAEILENPTIFPDEQGKLKIVVKNQGDTGFNGPVNIRLFASTDEVLDINSLNTLEQSRGASDLLRGKDELLGGLNDQTVNLAPGQSKTFTVDFAGSEFRTASVVSPGLYYLIGQVKPANNVTESNTANNVASQLITGGDVVIQWNSILLNAIQASGTAPPVAARNQAIVQAAVFDAVNAIDRSYKPYLVNISASETVGASKEAAAVEAAYQTLVNLFPNQKTTFDKQRQRSLAAIPNGTAEDKGIAIGNKVAQQILDNRQNDGSSTAQEPYTPGTGFGDWKPTFTDGETTNNTTNFKPALLPQWGLVTPFAIDSVILFRPDTFPEYGSPQYTKNFNQVKALGAENSTVRTADQTEIAQFWAYDRGDTFRPPGQLNELAQEVALSQNNTLEENARLFGLLNIAQADAGIVAWDAKYVYEQLRPITAIRNADQDNNPGTIADPNWEPLLDTPPFPDYISGHSVFAGVSAEILKLFYGTDNISFDIPSQELPGVARYYSSFSQAAQEDADSRIYGGVHIQAATIDGVEVGRNVGSFVFNNFLR